jgi:DNA repair exonuclease SbcCD ATPase subunit
MSSFICVDHDDEKLLIEILSSYSSDHRPPIYVHAYEDQVHDISGTVQCIKQANLLTIYDVLKIENITVECALIDFKQIETTVLVENLEEAKNLRLSGRLSWKKIHRKVKQVTEAWTCDGSNIKLDSTFRIYTNDKQPMKYFLSNSTQSLSIEELELEIKSSCEQIKQMNESLNQLKTTRQTTMNEINQTKKESMKNKRKMKELMKEHDRLNSIMPVILDCSLEELQEKTRKFRDIYEDTLRQYEKAKGKQEENRHQLDNLIENHENNNKKLENKTQQYDRLIEQLHDEQSKRLEILPQIQNSTKKSVQLNDELLKYRKKINQLTKKLSKKSKKTMVNIRSVRDIQNELDAINNYLQANQDTFVSLLSLSNLHIFF